MQTLPLVLGLITGFAGILVMSFMHQRSLKQKPNTQTGTTPFELDRGETRSWLLEIDRLSVPDETKRSLAQARIEAADIQTRFHPEHISSWPNLLTRLETTYRAARRGAVIHGRIDLESFDHEYNRVHGEK